jgi:hypothetical protein
MMMVGGFCFEEEGMKKKKKKKRVELSFVPLSLTCCFIIIFKRVCHVAHPNWAMLYNMKMANVTQVEPHSLPHHHS